jgi:hypothetical protein
MERKGKRNKHKKKTTTEKNTKVIPGCFFYFLNKTMETTRGRGKTTGSFKSFSILFWWGVENIVL